MSEASTPVRARDESASSARYTLSLISSPEEWDAPALRARWQELVETSDNVNALYASPVWFDLLRKGHADSDLTLAVARDEEGRIAGVSPVLFKDYPFQFYVSSRPVYTTRLKAANVLGSVPLLPDERGVHAQMRDALLDGRRDCDCIYMDTVPLDSPCRQFVSEPEQKDFLMYAPNGARPWHLLRLPATPDEYLSQMSSKTRYTLRKKAKKLAEAGGGELEMNRADSVETVAPFLTEAVEVSRNSWQHSTLGTRIDDSPEDRAWYAGLAEKGLLRCYVLKCGERPCAFVVGYQYNGIFHYVELGYNRELADFSPGTILLHMLIQDLCAHRPASLLNFGMGDADYKRRFGNVERQDISILIMRKNLSNRLRIESHKAFRSLVRAARNIVRRDKTQ